MFVDVSGIIRKRVVKNSVKIFQQTPKTSELHPKNIQYFGMVIKQKWKKKQKLHCRKIVKKFVNHRVKPFHKVVNFIGCVL